MTGWIIEPREPLIVRDGRPFTQQPGVMAATLPFPFPSTTAGAARSRAGSTDGVFAVARNDLPKLKQIKVRGPLLAEFDTDDKKWELLAPAPGDALLLEDQSALRCRRLVPLQKPEGAQMKPFHGSGNDLVPVGLARYDPAKPAKGQPAFWRWQVLQNWLLKPDQEMDNHLFTRKDLGAQALEQEERIHVALVRGMMVAREGALFETRGLEFTQKPHESASLEDARRLALWLDVDDCEDYRIAAGLDCLGGERRMVSWRRENELSLQHFDVLRAELSAQIVEKKACRLILLTPAFFQHGYCPGAELLAYQNIKPELKAILVQRPQVVSGWSVEAGKSGPKPTRRLAPAGSVFFLKFAVQSREEDIKSWVEHFWLNCIGDDEQLRRDGFGLAILGTWDGEPKEMSLEEEQA